MKYEVKIITTFPYHEKYMVVGSLKLLFYIWKYENNCNHFSYRKLVTR